jgi:hypothetical protein
MGNASKRDGEDNIVNNNVSSSLPPVYYYGNDAEEMKGGNGFAKGTFVDRGDGSQLGMGKAEGVFEKGTGMSGGHRAGDFAEGDNDEYRGAGHDLSKKSAKELGKMMGKIAMKGGAKCMEGGNFWDDFTDGLAQGFNMVVEPFAKIAKPFIGHGKKKAGRPKKVVCACGDKKCKGCGMSGGAILGNPDPYPVQGNSERIAGRGRGRPKKVGGAKKEMVGDKQHDLLAMPTPVLSNGVPPTAQLRGSYGGSKPMTDEEAKAELKRLVESKMVKEMTKKANAERPDTILNRYGGLTKEQVEAGYVRPKKGKGKVGAGDGRKKRAEIVKRIMKEKGMKMIDASRYVKEHNLYKP